MSILCSSFIVTVSAQSSGGSSINWYKLCKNPVVDILISEPCHTLTTNGGYTLTPEGEKVLACLGGGAIAALAVPELLSLKNKVGCGGDAITNEYSSSPNTLSNNNNNDPISNILEGLFG